MIFIQLHRLKASFDQAVLLIENATVPVLCEMRLVNCAYALTALYGGGTFTILVCVSGGTIIYHGYCSRPNILA